MLGLCGGEEAKEGWRVKVVDLFGDERKSRGEREKKFI